VTEFDKNDLATSQSIDITVFFGATAANKKYMLYVVAYNMNDEDGSVFLPMTNPRWFRKDYEFDVKSVADSGSFTPTRKRRTLRSLVQGRSSTALALQGGGRMRRDKKDPLLAAGGPIRITTTSGVEGKNGQNTGIEIAFNSPSLFSGVNQMVATAAGENALVNTNDLLNRTAQLCNIIANGTGRADVQLKALMAVYGDLLGEMQATDKTTTSQISRIMDKLRLNENLTQEQSKDVLAELKLQVGKMLDGTQNVLQVVEAETSMMKDMQNDSSWERLQENEVWAYMINKMESFEDALAVIQYTAAEAKDYRFTEAATMEEISTAQAKQVAQTNSDDDEWFQSAAGGTQITTLVLTSAMFVAGMTMLLTNAFKKDESLKGGYSLANNMNF